MPSFEALWTPLLRRLYSFFASFGLIVCVVLTDFGAFGLCSCVVLTDLCVFRLIVCGGLARLCVVFGSIWRMDCLFARMQTGYYIFYDKAAQIYNYFDKDSNAWM